MNILHEQDFQGPVTISGSNTTEAFNCKGMSSGYLIFDTITSCTFSVQAKMAASQSFRDWPCEDATLGTIYTAGLTISASTGKRVNMDLSGVSEIQITRVGGDGPVNFGCSSAPFISRLQSLSAVEQLRTGTTKSFTPTITASPDYSVLDVVGGIQTITTVNSVSGRPIKLTSVNLRDKTGLAPALTFMFFKATPASGTYTDNGALVLGSGDLANHVGTVKFVAGDWYIPVAGSGIATKGDVGQVMAIDATSLFCLIIADSTWNAASTSDLIVDLGIEQI